MSPIPAFDTYLKNLFVTNLNNTEVTIEVDSYLIKTLLLHLISGRSKVTKSHKYVQ